MNVPKLPATIVLTVLFLSACKDDPPPTEADALQPQTPTTDSAPAPSYTMKVSWTANREGAVNRTGGGYRIYYSTQAGFEFRSAPYLDVPYVSGATAPTSAEVTGLAAGTYFVKVVAISSISNSDTEKLGMSSPSAETTISLP